MNLRKRLYRLVSKSLPQCNMEVIFTSKNQLSSLSSRTQFKIFYSFIFCALTYQLLINGG